MSNERRISKTGWDRSFLAAFAQTLGESTPVMTANAGVLPLNELVDVVRTAEPEQIRRINRRRTVNT